MVTRSLVSAGMAALILMMGSSPAAAPTWQTEGDTFTPFSTLDTSQVVAGQECPFIVLEDGYVFCDG